VALSSTQWHSEGTQKALRRHSEGTQRHQSEAITFPHLATAAACIAVRARSASAATCDEGGNQCGYQRPASELMREAIRAHQTSASAASKAALRAFVCSSASRRAASAAAACSDATARRNISVANSDARRRSSTPVDACK
jgi:hypothetical protein